MNSKNMIFHVPKTIIEGQAAGFHIRVRNMLQAFEDCGYRVYLVSGTAQQRKGKIKEIKAKIKDGVQYDFLYAESATIPTLLTESHHLPLYPGLDFGFLKYCKKKNIPCGLFYRDIYWIFPEFKKKVSFLKRIFTLFFYRYDLRQYNQFLDYFYLPSKEMYPYVPFNFKGTVKDLPPGICKQYKKVTFIEPEIKDKLKILYVGGISPFYNLELMLQVIKEIPTVELVLCCRQNDWDRHRDLYKGLLGDNVKIIHQSGNGLVDLYNNTDVCSLFLEPSEWRSFAMPIKFFEYIQNAKPIIATKETLVGNIVNDEGIGWAIDYNRNALKSLLEEILSNSRDIESKRQSIHRFQKSSTWIKRAETVISDLCKESME